MNWYTIKALDKDGYELRVHDDWTTNKKEAIKDAHDMLYDSELNEEIDTVQVIDGNGECVFDDFLS